IRAEIQYPFYRAASRVNLWAGRIFAQADFVDLARLQSILGHASHSWQLYNAQGAIRAWVDFEQQSLRRAAADLALADVNLRLRGDLAPLALESLRGRLAYRQFGAAQAPGGQELVLEDFSMTGRAVELDTELAADDTAPLPRRLVIAPMQMRLRLTPANALRQVRGEFEASAISLGQLSALAAHIPLARQLRAVVARHAVSGELSQVSASWEGPIALAPPTQTITQWPKHYDIKAQFKHLSSVAVAAQPALNDQGHARLGLPGFQNLAGQIHLTEQLGTVRIQSQDITLEFPGLFEAPRKHFNTLEGTVQWRTDPASLTAPALQIERLTAINEAIDLTINGTYQARKQSPGSVNLSARIDRASAKHAHEYLPLAVSDHVRSWLQGALQAGIATQGSLKLRGNLSDFPYTRPGAEGEFRVNARIRGGVLDIDPQRSAQQSEQPDTPVWPVLRDIDADIVFEGSHLSITGRHAQTDNVSLSNITAHIANLSNAPRLQVSGALRGPLNDLLRITARSPVGKPLGDALAGALASGEASGQLSLDLPLTHADRTIQVAGSVRLKNNDIALRFLPTFTRTSGQLDFTERSLKLTDVRAGFVGGQTAITANTLDDGRIIFKAQGTATPAGARHLTDIPSVQKVFDRSVGTANYNATVTLANGKPDIRIESNLAGWGIDLPSPLGKLAGTQLPLLLRLTHFPTDPNKSHLQINAGSVFSLRYERQHTPTHTQSARITRGSIRITERNTTEPTDFPDNGVRLTVVLDKLDLDRWARVWSGSSNLAGAGKRVRAALSNTGAPDLISAQVQQLRFAGKPIANVVLGASRAADGSVTDTWLVNIDSDQASGALLIQPADEGNSARIRARLARLTIPESQRTEFTELLDGP
ncbi:MAG TPA: DUF3971 domain-containing protein, partial [Burkholderiaceae bacterium]|nr:DUF3971 domain-containing protein [Burkholderiaceae bacterium]